MTYKRYNNSKYSKHSKRSYRKNYYYEYDNGIDDFDAISALIVFTLLFSWLSYYYYIKPHLDSVLLFLKIFVPILLIVVGLVVYYIIKKRRKEEKEYIESRPSFIIGLENKIREFKPLRHYNEEKMYQIELAGFLKSNYSDLDIEIAKDYSRPDIVMEDIAIEIKGPTNMAGLKSLPDKINSYLPKRDFLFIVLFNIEIVYDIDENERIYKEKKKQIIDNMPDYKKDKVIFIEINS